MGTYAEKFAAEDAAKRVAGVQAIVEELHRKFADFRRAYDENGMTVEEFDRFGATARTLRTFIGSYMELVACVRDFMLPDPDKK